MSVSCSLTPHQQHGTHAAALLPGSRSTCCRNCPCRSKHQPWCRLLTSQYAMLFFPSPSRIWIVPMYYIARFSVSDQIWRPSCRGGRRTCIWWPYSCKKSATVQSPLPACKISYLEANPPQVAERTQNGRHDYCCSCTCAMTARRNAEVADQQRRRGG